MADSKKTTVVFTDKDFDKKKKKYVKKDVKLEFYKFDKVELEILDKPDVKNQSVIIGTLTIPGLDPCTIRENDGQYGTYRGGTVDKGQLYFGVKKGLARIGQSSPLSVTFREMLLEEEEASDALDALEGSEEDTPF